MADFARPRADEYHPYYQTYLDLVPADITDVLQHLKKQGLEMLTLMRTLDDARAEYRYQPDKWSIKEIIGHLIDTERLFAFRTLWLARGELNEQPGMDENLWGRNSNAHARRLPALWREQHVCRTDHVYLFRSLDQASIARRGTINGVETTARTIPWVIAGHERHHLKVLKERYGVG
ncbi:MAG: DinB family protein [Candidatus Krumholzibacteriota bacterium]